MDQLSNLEEAMKKYADMEKTLAKHSAVLQTIRSFLASGEHPVRSCMFVSDTVGNASSRSLSTRPGATI